ncbi:MAG: thiol:disulfide interchange protein [Alphaproteobacteria bacterium RIFOXYD12_FULL_60_8]|nr:MAG: thiol:disulfide interchange protein [Alphaproteobacteria bacterium RIFOXYD12_FULL_60_8]
MTRLAYLIPMAIFAILAAFFIVRLEDVKRGEDPKKLDSVLIDKAITPFDLPPLPGRGEATGLSSENLKGEVTLVNFFGSWCVTCKLEHPFLMRLKELKLVPLHGIDFNEPAEKGMIWLAQGGDPYDRVGSDPNGRVVLDFGLTGAPETYLVDQQGVIRYRHQGAMTQEVWDAEIWPLIVRLREGK